MLVVRGQISFAEAFAVLHKSCFSQPWSQTEFQKLLALPTTIGWITEQGFLLCSHVLDEMEILTIGVLPEFRKQGVALQLLKELTDYARDNQVKKIFLEVASDNQPAKNLYIKTGFNQTGMRKNYYKRNDGFTDALCLTKVMD